MVLEQPAQVPRRLLCIYMERNVSAKALEELLVIKNRS
jgi:hypothetical protein